MNSDHKIYPLPPVEERDAKHKEDIARLDGYLCARAEADAPKIAETAFARAMKAKRERPAR